jgi:hypothetical protein
MKAEMESIASQVARQNSEDFFEVSRRTITWRTNRSEQRL